MTLLPTPINQARKLLSEMRVLRRRFCLLQGGGMAKAAQGFVVHVYAAVVRWPWRCGLVSMGMIRQIRVVRASEVEVSSVVVVVVVSDRMAKR